jgi:hypothetical protein
VFSSTCRYRSGSLHLGPHGGVAATANAALATQAAAVSYAARTRRALAARLPATEGRQDGSRPGECTRPSAEYPPPAQLPAAARRSLLAACAHHKPFRKVPHVGSHGRIHIACIRRITSRQSRADLMADLRTFAAPPSAPEGMRLRLSPECESVGDAVTDRPRGGGAPSTWLAGT